MWKEQTKPLPRGFPALTCSARGSRSARRGLGSAAGSLPGKPLWGREGQPSKQNPAGPSLRTTSTAAGAASETGYQVRPLLLSGLCPGKPRTLEAAPSPGLQGTPPSLLLGEGLFLAAVSSLKLPARPCSNRLVSGCSAGLSQAYSPGRSPELLARKAGRTFQGEKRSTVLPCCCGHNTHRGRQELLRGLTDQHPALSH